jgi:hypothetical protein
MVLNMKKLLLAVAIIVSTPAFATEGFQVGGGFGSSATLSGGSQATSGSNGNGYSYQTANSSGAVFAVGATGIAATAAPYGIGGMVGGISGSYATGGSVTSANSYGTTGYDGYGATKSGAGADYSSYGNNGIAASYHY